MSRILHDQPQLSPKLSISFAPCASAPRISNAHCSVLSAHIVLTPSVNVGISEMETVSYQLVKCEGRYGI